MTSIEPKFYQTQFVDIVDVAYQNNMRVNIDCFLIYYLIKFFKCSNILEIGFNQGQTFAVMIEAAEKYSNLTAIDIDLNLEIYNKYYNNSTFTQDKNIKFFEIDSIKFISKEKYDFVNIDGDHSKNYAFNDMVNGCFMMQPNGILMIDDYKLEGVNEAIDEFLKINSNFVPFLNTEQTSFWHHNNHDATEFLDNVLEELLAPFCTLYNTDYKSYNVKDIKCLPAVTKNNDVFKLICEKYKI